MSDESKSIDQKYKDDKYFKCRFCDFKTLKFRRLSDGRIKGGWDRLYSHIEECHPAEAAKRMLNTKR